MTWVALKSLAERRVRAALTALAIVLGVAMVAGSFILTDTIDRAFTNIFSSTYTQTDLVVRGDAVVDEAFAGTPTVSEDLLPRIQAVPGVEAAAGSLVDFSGTGNTAKILDNDGEVIGGNMPSFGFGVDPSQERFNPLRLTTGHWASGPGEVVIDTSTASGNDIAVGDAVRIVADGPVREFTVTGIARFGEVDSLGGATIAVFDVPTARDMLGKTGFDAIQVAAAPGTSQDTLAGRIEAILPPGAELATGEEQAARDKEVVSEGITFIRGILLAFGGIALFVGAFIIFNTMSITVAQRAREFALIRMVGGSRRQILRSVILEAFVIGLIASVVGLLVGLGLAAGLNAVFKSLGADLPDSGTVFKTRTVIVAFIVGVGVTVLAALSPARRATRVAPVIAFREGVLGETRRTRRHAYGAIATTVIGVALLGYGMFASGVDIVPRLLAIGGGVIVLFIGVALFSSRLVRPLASLVGRPAARIAGAAGRLARDNAMRNPSRTAVTAAALMIGIALVTFVAVLGQGLRASYGSSFDDQVDTDYVVTAQDTFSPFAPEAGNALRRNPDVSALTSIREDQVQTFGKKVGIDRIEPATIGRFYNFNWDPGSDAVLAQLGADGAIVSRSFADDHALAVGKRFRAVAPDGTRLNLTVKGIDKPESFDPLGLGEIFVAPLVFDRTFQTQRDRFVFFDGRPGTTKQDFEAALQRFPETKLFTGEGYRKDQESQINEFLNLLYVLLALSVIVSLFGIVNTLVLSVFERTRELGMLRAIGMSRRQTRRMVRHESIIVALIGSVLGMAVGVFLAALVTAALSSEGVTFSLPVGTLIAFLVVAVLAGMLAAVLPARRASRLNVLEALQYE